MTTSESIRSTVTSDGLVLLDVRTGNIFNSNSVGAQIWLKLQEGLELDAIVEHLSADFNVSQDQLRQDIDDFVGKLKVNGIIGNPGGK